MLGHEMRHAGGVITVTALILGACGGSSSSGGGTGGGSGGSNVTTSSATTGGSTVTGAGGGAGTAVTGTGGNPNLNDAGRIPCGMANNGMGCNPNGNNRLCDIANNRCVQCTSDTDCTANPNRMGTPYCDTVGLNGAGLPNDTCEECLMDSQCAAGRVCANHNCVVNCTTDAQCAAATPMTPVCNTAVMPGQCVQCLNDTQCVGVTDNNGVPRPHCGLPMMNGANQCRACNTDADCAPGLVCGRGGTCNMGFDGGPGRRDGATADASAE